MNNDDNCNNYTLHAIVWGYSCNWTPVNHINKLASLSINCTTSKWLGWCVALIQTSSSIEVIESPNDNLTSVTSIVWGLASLLLSLIYNEPLQMIGSVNALWVRADNDIVTAGKHSDHSIHSELQNENK